MKRIAGILIACTCWAVASAAAAGETPAANYKIHCRGCHLADGSGRPPDVPSLVGQMGRFLGVPGGRAFLVQVPGTANAPLDDADVAALLNWMLRTFSADTLPAAFTPYTASEVTAYRRNRLLNAIARRKELIAAMDETPAG